MKKKIIRWALVIGWMIVIFLFSSQNGEQSGQNNKFVIDMLKHMGINLDVLIGSLDNFIIRKLAHMTEYFILFQLLFYAIFEERKFAKTLFLSLILTFLYACTDEYHQSFIPGRGPSFRDVLIDTGGGSIALIYRFLRSRLRKPIDAFNL